MIIEVTDFQLCILRQHLQENGMTRPLQEDSEGSKGLSRCSVKSALIPENLLYEWYKQWEKIRIQISY